MIRLNDCYPKQIQSKNRSSKHLRWLTGRENKSVMRCVGGNTLAKWAAVGVPGAQKELSRRQKRQDAKADKGQ